MKKIDFSHIDLPIVALLPQIKQLIEKESCLIVKAPPGAGKSTLLPLVLLAEKWMTGKRILMLEPRRLAARSVANRMADLLNNELGQTVGYRIRFENRTCSKTRIEVLTEGILTKMLQNDNALEGVGLVIFDEFHERNLHADLAMALCREAQQILRPDLKILVMSATIDLQNLASLLQAKVLESAGRQFPVTINYTGDVSVQSLAEQVGAVIEKAVKENDGDVLAFLPGQAEILKCESILKIKLPEFSIHPLYGQLPQNKQYAAIWPNKNGRRKIVLSTSIAETSLTIEGIKIVVDSGFGRYSQFDPNTGLSRLETKMISIDEAEQRTGRAGRLYAGVCYRMWTTYMHNSLEVHRKPEIEQADLADLVLDLAQWGVDNPLELAWLSPPPAGALAQASEILHELEALENNKITAHGKQIHRIVCHPRIAHMLVKAQEINILALGTDLAAIIEERDFMPQGSNIDLNLRIEALRKFRLQKTGLKQLTNIERVAESYRRIFAIQAENNSFDPYSTGLLLAYAYPERIACARPGNNAQFQLSNGKIASFSHKDSLANEAWLAVAHVDAREGSGKIFTAAPLNPRDLMPLLKEKEKIKWNADEQSIEAKKELCIGSIILKSTALEKISDEKVIPILCEIIKKNGAQLLEFTEKLEHWQARVECLRIWRPNEDWPNVSKEHLLQTANQWLKPHLNGVRKAFQFKKIDLLTILNSHLNWEQRQSLDKFCPPFIDVPSGSRIQIDYKMNGENPSLSVRLQELFGLMESPAVNENRNIICIHLLSPGYKPVQITSDLKNFWENTYYEVKNELKRRYPKHSWPENPIGAVAVRGVKKKV